MSRVTVLPTINGPMTTDQMASFWVNPCRQSRTYFPEARFLANFRLSRKSALLVLRPRSRDSAINHCVDIDNSCDYSERNTLIGFIDIALRAGK
jgi:hypothetical protein